MRRYSIRFLDHGGRVYGTDEMHGADDDDVIARARGLHDHGIGRGYEIWDGDRRVHTERKR